MERIHLPWCHTPKSPRRPAIASRSACILLAFLTATSVEATAQTGRVEIAAANTKELKRTAYRSRMSVEDLQRARALLEEATELARRTEPAGGMLGRIADLWVRFHRSAAATRLDPLVTKVRTRAQEATELAAYKTATTTALPLLTAFGEADLDRALEIARSWPAAPSGSGEEGEEARRGLERSLRRNVTQRLSFMDPERAALASRGASGGDGSLGYLALATQAATRTRAGQQEEALRLVEQAVADFEQDPSLPSPPDLMMFLQSLGQVDTSRAVRVFGALARSQAVEVGSYQGFPTTLANTLRSGETTVVLTPPEAVALGALQSLYVWPELAVRGLAAFPALKGKLDALGGLDATRSSGMRPAKVEFVPDSPAYSDMSGSWREAMRLQTELGGKTARELEGVERLLADKEPRTLIVLAQRANWENPDLASLALRKATDLAFRVTPLEKRVEVLVSVVSATRMIEGDIDGDLVARVLRTIDEVRAEGKVEAAPGSDPMALYRERLGVTSVDLSEATVLGMYARADFEAALLLARRVPEARRVGVLVQIVQYSGM